MAIIAVLILVSLFAVSVPAFPIAEQGKWTLSLDQDYGFGAVGKNMFKDDKVSVTVSLQCGDENPDGIEISWIFLKLMCFERPFFKDVAVLMSSNESQQVQALEKFMKRPSRLWDIDPLSTIEWLSGISSHNCSEGEFTMQGVPDQKLRVLNISGDTSRYLEIPVASSGHEDHTENVANTWFDGNYLFLIQLSSKQADTIFSAQVTIGTFFGYENYISALDYPLLICYGVMFLVYIVYILMWLELMACNRRYLLREQNEIKQIIILGVLQYATIFGLYGYVNNTGRGNNTLGLILLGCWIGVFILRSSAFFGLIMRASVGFTMHYRGKTHIFTMISEMLNKILLSILCFCILFYTKVYILVVMGILGALLVALWFAITVWVVKGFRRTTQILRGLDVKKLRRYRWFFAALVLTFLSSLVCFPWTYFIPMSNSCTMRWIEAVFLHTIHALLMLITMLLWRPSKKNRWYALARNLIRKKRILLLRKRIYKLRKRIPRKKACERC